MARVFPTNQGGRVEHIHLLRCGPLSLLTETDAQEPTVTMSSLTSAIVRVSVVLKRTVGYGD